MLNQYQVNSGFDEMADAQNQVRPHYQKFHKLFAELTEPEFQSKREAIDNAFLRQGVTFNVYGDAAARRKFSRSIYYPELFRRRSGSIWNAV